MTDSGSDSDNLMREAGQKRRGGRRGRRALVERPAVFHRPVLERNIPHVDLLGPDGVARIHDMAMRITEEIGVEFHDPDAIALWKAVGAEVDGWRVRAPRDLLMELIANAPADITHHGRNPERSVTFGQRNMVLAPSYGMPYVRDLDGTRRSATLADLDAVQKLTHMARAVHIAGGPIVEPMDIAVPHRHLHSVFSSLKYSDKPIIGAVTAPSRARDTIAMLDIVFGAEFRRDNTVVTSLINSVSPLVWDRNSLQCLAVYASHNQAVIAAPFSMAGASTPASPVGTMAVVCAENVMAMALTQLISKGAPVIFGVPAMTVSMKSGAPVFGHPDSALIQLLAGMMARHYKVPHRAIGNCATGSFPDIYAGYDSMWGMFSAFMAGANWISHAGGVIENTMTLCFSKLMLDYEQMDGFFHFARGVEVEDADALIEVVKEVGPGGHFLGTAHTRQGRLYNLPMQDTARYEQWMEEGARTALDFGTEEARRQLERYEAPPLAGDIEPALTDFVARRCRDIPEDAVEE